MVDDRDRDGVAVQVGREPADPLLVARVEHDERARLGEARLGELLGVDLDRRLEPEPGERARRGRVIQDPHLLPERTEHAGERHLAADRVAVGVEMSREQEPLVARHPLMERHSLRRGRRSAHRAASSERPATSRRNHACRRRSPVSSGWNASAATRPWRTPTGSSPKRAMIGPQPGHAHRLGERMDLAAPGVPRRGDVQHTERRARELVGLAREQDEPRARAQHGQLAHGALERSAEPGRIEQPQHRRRFSARQHERREGPQVLGQRDADRLATQLRERRRVEREIALQAQHPHARSPAGRHLGAGSDPAPSGLDRVPRRRPARAGSTSTPWTPRAGGDGATSHVSQAARPRTASRARSPASPAAAPC